MTLKEMVERAHGMSREKGWYDGAEAGTPWQRNIGEMLALIHSEVSEALEDWRVGALEEFVGEKGKPCGFPSELADIVIRVGDLCGYLDLDLQGAVERKMVFNATREYRHGGKKA